MLHLFDLNQNLIKLTTSAIHYFRVQSYRFASKTMQEILDKMEDLLNSLNDSSLRDYSNDITSILSTILDAQENSDFILIADIMEINLLPALNQIQQIIIQAQPDISIVNVYQTNIDALGDSPFASKIPCAKAPSTASSGSAGYSVEPSTVGANILRFQSNSQSFYLHSNNNPLEEGRIFAQEYSDAEYLSYTVLGFGMGYHIRELLEIDRRYEITVLETSIDVLSLAFTYGNISDILRNPRFHLIYNTDSGAISDLIQKGAAWASKLIIHYPSMMALKEGPVKSALKQYFIKLSSMQANGKYLNWNFYSNQKKNHPSVDLLKPHFGGKTIVLLAGGPSLESSIDFIKRLDRQSGSYVLISVGTSYRGLIAHGIVPDYVIITDAGDRMFYQVKSTEKTGASLIYLCSASSHAVDTFEGDKYIMYQKDFKDAEAFANANSLTLFETGGSVSTTAIDLALRFSCDKLITFGLDLSYPDNRRHSFNSSDTAAGDRDLISVKSTNGGTVLTTNVLTIYKKWIEKRLSCESRNKMLNISDGAWIDNAKNLPTSILSSDFTI